MNVETQMKTQIRLVKALKAARSEALNQVLATLKRQEELQDFNVKLLDWHDEDEVLATGEGIEKSGDDCQAIGAELEEKFTALCEAHVALIEGFAKYRAKIAA